jgi:Na+/H+ antiporter NhaD/arsenite permease-like protein
MEMGTATGADAARSAATRTRMLTAIRLLLMDLAVFAGASVFLPRTMGTISWHNALGHFVNSQERWDIAWGVFLAAVLFSAGIFLLMEALGAFRGIRKTSDPTRAGNSGHHT